MIIHLLDVAPFEISNGSRGRIIMEKSTKISRRIFAIILSFGLIALYSTGYVRAETAVKISPHVMQISESVAEANALVQYKKYYEKKVAQYSRILESTESETSMMAAQTSIDIWTAKISDIERLAHEGNVTGVTLKIPTYNQLDIPNNNGTSLCWATCASMWISYLQGDNASRTKQIATAVAGSQKPADYNVCRRWTSLDSIPGLSHQLGITQRQEEIRSTLTMSEIKQTFQNRSPFVALYGAYEGSVWYGHYVIAIGYASAPGHEPLIISVDPMGGIMRIQTENEFRGNYVGDELGFRAWAHTVREVNES